MTTAEDQRSQSMKEQAYNVDRDKDHKSLTTKAISLISRRSVTMNSLRGNEYEPHITLRSLLQRILPTNSMKPLVSGVVSRSTRASHPLCEFSMDKSKVSRKQSKASKLGHENQKSTKPKPEKPNNLATSLVLKP
ncbi:hypothetical protein Tco_0857439 [Tanacetum coccineum]|uniref:Uncharacterized protein n=1 Tax=Tanacetum coccineum TaxID=301880 RepID=A0ABQ5B8E1_9ASTR